MSIFAGAVTAAPELGSLARRSINWERTGVLLLLTATAASFLWALDNNGWANPYYSAAAQAGSQDWKAFFFGSFEWGNLITVDKPPLSIWVMALSVRLFGLNSWAILVPQAVMGVASTYFVYRIIRHGFGPAPSLLGGAVYATTPVVFLMSRFNNPEPLMGLLTLAAVYVSVRAMGNWRVRSFAAIGILLGLGFMTKQAQAFVVIPALLTTILLFGQGGVGARLRRIVVAGAALCLTAAAWIGAVELTPALNRPYIGGSWTNSAIELTLDYNGLGRFIQVPITVAGDRPTSGNDELAPYNGGFPRMFDGNFAPEIAWLLFSALAMGLVFFALNRTLSLNEDQKQMALISIIWLFMAFLLLSFMGTAIHTYYTYSLAAPISLVLPIGLSVLWRCRERWVLRLTGAVLVGASGYMAVRILSYSDEWPVWFRALLIICTVAAAVGWLLSRTHRWSQLSLALVAVTLLLGPLGANAFTLSTPQKGTNPQSGPVANDPRAISRHMIGVKAGTPAWATQTAFGARPSPSVVNLLRQTGGTQKWAAATYSAQNAALYQLESGRPVIPVGGWLGTDPAPTLATFKALVSDGKVGYFIWQQDLLDRAELSSETMHISKWVQDNFEEQTVDGVRIYDLRK